MTASSTAGSNQFPLASPGASIHDNAHEGARRAGIRTRPGESWLDLGLWGVRHAVGSVGGVQGAGRFPRAIRSIAISGGRMADAGMATGSAVASENITRNEWCRHATPAGLGGGANAHSGIAQCDTDEAAVDHTNVAY